jgi:UDP-N-acetylmuramoyl-L-alanyl-D-glutamate--2,6-diaminopimelate ligase
VVPVSADQISEVVVDASSHRYRWRGRDVVVPIGGRFNVANSLAAITTAVELGIDPQVAAEGLRTVAAVPGRFEVVHSSAADQHGFTVIVDYAHTPDGLAEVLTSARGVADPGGSVVVVFGCGGGRDRPKRPEMGRVAVELADRVIVTSDNPRGEPPEAIIGDIIDGVPRDHLQRVVTELDRRDAIHRAIEGAQRGDVIVLAGKGHERTQEFADRTIDFDDRRVANELLEALA